MLWTKCCPFLLQSGAWVRYFAGLKWCTDWKLVGDGHLLPKSWTFGRSWDHLEKIYWAELVLWEVIIGAKDIWWDGQSLLFDGRCGSSSFLPLSLLRGSGGGQRIPSEISIKSKNKVVDEELSEVWLNVHPFPDTLQGPYPQNHINPSTLAADGNTPARPTINQQQVLRQPKRYPGGTSQYNDQGLVFQISQLEFRPRCQSWRTRA